MKTKSILCALLALMALTSAVVAPAVVAPAAVAENSNANLSPAQVGVEMEALSSAAARELPGVALQINLEKTNFESGEPIAVALNYRNEGIATPSAQHGLTPTQPSPRP